MYKTSILLFILTFLGCYSNDEVERILELEKVIEPYEKGNFKKSLENGLEYTKKYPKEAMGFHMVSSSYLALNKDSLAWLYTDTTLTLNPKNHVALTNRGIILDKKGQYEKAENYYKKSLKIKPDLAQTYSNYAGNRFYVKEYDKAIGLCEKAIELANSTSDKGVLCALYHKVGAVRKRDSLFEELEKLNYKNLEKLKEVIE